MRLFLGLLESSLPDDTRIFSEVDQKLVDLNMACTAYFAASEECPAVAYDLAALYFPKTITEFLKPDGGARQVFAKVVEFVRHSGNDLHGPHGEKVLYNPTEVRILPPFLLPERSFVIGFSDRARTEALPKAEISTAFYKLPQTFVADGAPIVWPKFSGELDADACLALVIGKPGRRIPAEAAWDHIGGITLLIDITARDVNRREGLTTNNLLGKNFPSSTSLGPAMLVKPARSELEKLDIELAIDGEVKQKFALGDCVFTIEQIVARWSILGLKPGDFLAIGASMALAGDRLQNPAPLKIGSTVRCSSPAIGMLSHKVGRAEEIHR
jgi:2-keto-4-pentenoate hydratase/2-oxohepta-3-ene-1,7-dioic acid hydratase in catechol pathway